MKEYRDHYFLKAKQENYPARSVYKLKEIDGRFKIFRKGMKVLDLGAAPGSWSLGAAERVGAQGKVLACDIQSTVTVFPPNVEFHQEDVFRRSETFERQLAETGPFHVVMSDMAPQTTGTKFTDQARAGCPLAQQPVQFRASLQPQPYKQHFTAGPDIGSRAIQSGSEPVFQFIQRSSAAQIHIQRLPDRRAEGTEGRAHRIPAIGPGFRRHQQAPLFAGLVDVQPLRTAGVGRQRFPADLAAVVDVPERPVIHAGRLQILLRERRVPGHSIGIAGRGVQQPHVKAARLRAPEERGEVPGFPA